MLVGEVVQPAICVAARKKLHAFQMQLVRRAVTRAGPPAGSSWPTDAELLKRIGMPTQATLTRARQLDYMKQLLKRERETQKDFDQATGL